MKLPKLTTLQFFVMDSVGNGVRSAGQVMKALKECDEARDPSAFYQLMGRMTRDKLVKGKIKSSTFNGRHYRERFYLLTKNGKRLYNETVAFYAGKSPL
jgi:hypothetical protein